MLTVHMLQLQLHTTAAGLGLEQSGSVASRLLQCFVRNCRRPLVLQGLSLKRRTDSFTGEATGSERPAAMSASAAAEADGDS